jgi:hypothetical protein
VFGVEACSIRVYALVERHPSWAEVQCDACQWCADTYVIFANTSEPLGISIPRYRSSFLTLHNTDEPFSFPQNERIIIHDSQGFEPGSKEISRQSPTLLTVDPSCQAFDDQLRAIWSAEHHLRCFTSHTRSSGSTPKYLSRAADSSRKV